MDYIRVFGDLVWSAEDAGPVLVQRINVRGTVLMLNASSVII